MQVPPPQPPPDRPSTHALVKQLAACHHYMLSIGKVGDEPVPRSRSQSGPDAGSIDSSPLMTPALLVLDDGGQRARNKSATLVHQA